LMLLVWRQKGHLDCKISLRQYSNIFFGTGRTFKMTDKRMHIFSSSLSCPCLERSRGDDPTPKVHDCLPFSRLSVLQCWLTENPHVSLRCARILRSFPVERRSERISDNTTVVVSDTPKHNLSKGQRDEADNYSCADIPTGVELPDDTTAQHPLAAAKWATSAAAARSLQRAHIIRTQPGGVGSVKRVFCPR